MTKKSRDIAITSYNRAQELLYIQRTSPQDLELLEAASTSRNNWRLVGGEKEFAISDWLMSRVYVQFQQPIPAIDFALASLSHNQNGFPAWLKASLFEGTARAYKCAGEINDFENYKALSLAELANEPDAEDFQIISEQIDEL